MRIVLLRVGSQGLPTVDYSELSTERSIIKKTGNDLYRSLSSRSRAAGPAVLTMLYCLRVGCLKCETIVVTRYLRVLYTVAMRLLL